MAITITTTPSTEAIQGTHYSYYPAAIGAVINYWALTGAPVGMTFDSSTGAIDWTPGFDQTTSGPLTLTVYDDSTDFQNWTITVTAGSPGGHSIDPSLFLPIGSSNTFYEIPANRLALLAGGLVIYV